MEDKTLSLTLLFDYYGDLLTEKQKTYCDLYYNQDFSLAEIAEEEGISRQGVYDALQRSEAILRNMEEKTGFVKKAQERTRLLEEIRKAALAVKELPQGAPLADTILSAIDGMKE
ncbi:MAG: YlxM family DNA-binding protein [Oscillospiraceae bacterium]|nr:YlxM family DNA-binding protein [Oscillospiraceae bacterium]